MAWGRSTEPRTPLSRDVAIKVLPGDFASDPERPARFKREARLRASLNHPNIAQVYGLEEGIVHRHLKPGDGQLGLPRRLRAVTDAGPHGNPGR